MICMTGRHFWAIREALVLKRWPGGTTSGLMGPAWMLGCPCRDRWANGRLLWQFGGVGRVLAAGGACGDSGRPSATAGARPGDWMVRGATVGSWRLVRMQEGQ